MFYAFYHIQILHNAIGYNTWCSAKKTNIFLMDICILFSRKTYIYKKSVRQHKYTNKELFSQE